jgi:hypothetical protein
MTSYGNLIYESPLDEQWQRVSRWYGRVKDIEKNSSIAINVTEQEDFILSYFQNLYIFKDWLIKTVQKDNVEKLFDKDNGVLSLKIVADLVINYKHAENKRNPRIDPETWIVRRDAINSVPSHTW